jgi:SP family general alpha glucoside:H+ symporter-like MFS transporter
MTSTVGYAAEVCPIRLRGYLTAYINMCWGIGILLSSGVVKACLSIQTDWSWRIPLFAISYFCPPSPWWMVRKGRFDDAKAAVRRLTNPALFSDAEVDDSVAYMIHTTEMEKQVSEGTSYIQCFRGTDRRRTEIAMMTFTMQASHLHMTSVATLTCTDSQRAVFGWSRCSILATSRCQHYPILFAQHGSKLDVHHRNCRVVDPHVILGSTNHLHYRNGLHVCGEYTHCNRCIELTSQTLYIVAALGFHRTPETTMAMGSLLIVLNFIYNCTIGPSTYTIIGEISSTRLRQKTIVLARASYKAINIVAGILNPRMLCDSLEIQRRGSC